MLRAALISDALDAIDRPGRSLPPEIAPLEPGKVVVGRAFPVTVTRVARAPEVPYVGLLAALDQIGPGDVFVISSGGARDVALWGELLSMIGLARGAVGAICDGYVRDAAQIRALGFRVFAHGTMPIDINGRLEVTGHGSPIDIDGVEVALGELIIADDDGVVVVPREVEREVLGHAIAKATAEDAFRADVASGMLPSKAYALHRVL